MILHVLQWTVCSLCDILGIREFDVCIPGLFIVGHLVNG